MIRIDILYPVNLDNEQYDRKVKWQSTLKRGEGIENQKHKRVQIITGQ